MAPEECEIMKIDVENWNPETWQEILNISKPLVEFLEKDSYFDVKFNNTDEDKFYVIKDAKLAVDIMTDKDCEEYDDWEIFPFSEEVFPSGYENIYRIEVKLDKINYFNLEKKQFNGAEIKIKNENADLLIDLMKRDFRTLFNCYTSGVFPELWKDIFTVYLNNGFPCGWEGMYPEGRLIVFSNE